MTNKLEKIERAADALLKRANRALEEVERVQSEIRRDLNDVRARLDRIERGLSASREHLPVDWESRITHCGSARLQ